MERDRGAADRRHGPPRGAGALPHAEATTIVLVVTGQIDPATLPKLCERIHALLESSHADLVICDVGAISEPDAGTIDALARLQLTAQRLGRRVRLLEASGELEDLLSLTGLSDVIPCEELLLESRRKPKQREPALGIEEEGDPADPVA